MSSDVRPSKAWRCRLHPRSRYPHLLASEQRAPAPPTITRIEAEATGSALAQTDPSGRSIV
nr:putative integron gene cassette protein [uncultured bacterium]